MRKISKSIKQCYFILSLFVIFISCAKKPINGDLDGRWQLMTVESHEDGIRTNSEYTYYDISLHMIDLKRKTDEDKMNSAGLPGRFAHTGDSLHIRMIRCKQAQMPPFGMNDTIQHFAVEELNKKKMTLNSDYARLRFRKF